MSAADYITSRNTLAQVTTYIKSTASPIILLHNVMYEEFAWLIITGSRLDDWIYWHSLQLQLIITAHNQWLLKTRSNSYWTTSVFTSAVTDLVLIYETVTPSASVVRWLTLHSWTLNFWILLRMYHWIPYEWRLRMPSLSQLGMNRRETTTSNISCTTASIRCSGNVLTEPLPSNGHIRHNINMPSVEH
jgi:hypothetical protein